MRLFKRDDLGFTRNKAHHNKHIPIFQFSKPPIFNSKNLPIFNSPILYYRQPPPDLHSSGDDIGGGCNGHVIGRS